MSPPGSFNPAAQQRCAPWHCAGLGSSPFARRYWGNHYYFLFLRVLRWFSSPGLPLMALCVHAMAHVIRTYGLPHSVTRASQDICSYTRLFAACHDLLRPPAPRHPPWTLSYLTILFLCPFSIIFQKTKELEAQGFEPWTPGLQSRCSSQLSYAPKYKKKEIKSKAFRPTR